MRTVAQVSEYSAEQSFIDLLFRVPLHETEGGDAMGERANQEPVIKVDVGMDKKTELEFFFKQKRKHQVRGNGRSVMQKFTPTLTVAHQKIDVIVAENIALIIADEPLIAADNNRVRAVATDNKSFWFHVVLKKHPYGCGY